MDAITAAILGLTNRVTAYRIYQYGGWEMAVKWGIADKALKMRGNMERLNAAYDTFNEKAPAHAADVEGMAGTVEQLNEDLGFAANLLGNSSGNTEQSEKGEKQVITTDEVHRIIPGGVVSVTPITSPAQAGQGTLPGQGPAAQPPQQPVGSPRETNFSR